MSDEKDGVRYGGIAVAVMVLLPVLYIVSGQFMGRVNNKVMAVPVADGGSRVADVMARMIERDVHSGFCPSSYFWPGHIRYDVCGFQEGEQQIWQRLAMQLSDHLTREGAASDRDPDLTTVLANVSRPNTWSLLFASNNTSSLLKGAVIKLDDYNGKLRQGRAGYFPRIDNLASLVGDLTNVLGSEAKQLSDRASVTGLYSMQGREAYFHTLGTMAAVCNTLKAAQVDFGDVLKSQAAEDIFAQAQQKSCEKTGKNPAIVINANDLSHLLSLSGAASAAVNNLAALQTALAAGARVH